MIDQLSLFDASLAETPTLKPREGDRLQGLTASGIFVTGIFERLSASGMFVVLSNEGQLSAIDPSTANFAAPKSDSQETMSDSLREWLESKDLYYLQLINKFSRSTRLSAVAKKTEIRRLMEMRRAIALQLGRIEEWNEWGENQ